jgi:hypothetical protein
VAQAGLAFKMWQGTLADQHDGFNVQSQELRENEHVGDLHSFSCSRRMDMICWSACSSVMYRSSSLNASACSAP